MYVYDNEEPIHTLTNMYTNTHARKLTYTNTNPYNKCLQNQQHRWPFSTCPPPVSSREERPRGDPRVAAVEAGTAEMVTRQGQFEPRPPARGAAGSSQGYGKGRRWRGAYAPGTATSASPRVMDEPVRSGQFSGSLGGTALCPKSDPVSNKHWPSLRSPASEGRPFQHPLTSNKGDHKY